MALLSQAPALHAQTRQWDPHQAYASRDSLQHLLNSYEAAAASRAYSKTLRQQAEDDAARVRNRLHAGDFQVGDRILLTVEQDSTLPDTLTVGDGPSLVLPTLGTMSLQGVLRSELTPRLHDYIAKYVRDPVVRSRVLIRLSITGEVSRPGFYTVPSESPLTDVLMNAGGPTGNAKLNDIRVERADTSLWSAAALQPALEKGRTLDQLSLRGGDRIVVGKKSGGLGAAQAPVRVITYLLSIPAAVFALTRLF